MNDKFVIKHQVKGQTNDTLKMELAFHPTQPTNGILELVVSRSNGTTDDWLVYKANIGKYTSAPIENNKSNIDKNASTVATAVAETYAVLFDNKDRVVKETTPVIEKAILALSRTMVEHAATIKAAHNSIYQSVYADFSVDAK